MTSTAPKQNRAAVFPVAMGIAFAMCAAGYYLLVVRADAAAEHARLQADQLEAEIDRARAYLTNRPDEKAVLKQVDAVAADVQRRIAVGRSDLAVAQYLQKQAAEAGIGDLKYEITGGFVMAEAKQVQAAKQTPIERLALDPAKLQSVTLELTCSARYRELLKFHHALAEAPWPLEIESAEVRRSDKGGQVLQVKLRARYLYQ